MGWDRVQTDGICTALYFNPPTPCGVGQAALWGGDKDLSISIHPPRVGWDIAHHLRGDGAAIRFQSTHPVWGGTRLDCPRWGRGTISIHPPRVGWDGFGPMKPTNADNFNPPTPCGVGLTSGAGIGEVPIFQSTHPVWGGTSCHVSCSPSIPNFNPPTPCGVGLQIAFNFALLCAFQSTHPVWGGTHTIDEQQAEIKHFNPPTPCGVGHRQARRSGRPHDFNPPTPCGVGPRPGTLL